MKEKFQEDYEAMLDFIVPTGDFLSKKKKPSQELAKGEEEKKEEIKLEAMNGGLVEDTDSYLSAVAINEERKEAEENHINAFIRDVNVPVVFSDVPISGPQNSELPTRESTTGTDPPLHQS